MWDAFQIDFESYINAAIVLVFVPPIYSLERENPMSDKCPNCDKLSAALADLTREAKLNREANEAALKEATSTVSYTWSRANEIQAERDRLQKELAACKLGGNVEYERAETALHLLAEAKAEIERLNHG